VIKAVLAMRHELLPRTLHLDMPSSQVDWSSGSVSLLVEEVPWRGDGRPRRAGVSSFGISGTNAHVILEEPPATARTPADPGANAWNGSNVVPLVVSAKHERALRAQAARLADHLGAAVQLGSLDVGRSLVARAELEHRAVVLGSDREALLGGLTALAEASSPAGVVEGVVGAGTGAIAFLFTGQGAQHAGMGAGLYAAFPVFKDALDEVCAHMDEHLGRPLRAVVLGDVQEDGVGVSERSPLDDTLFTQPGLFALETALFRLTESLGIRPDFVMGHSIGELVAAHVAGVFSLEDACRLVVARGRLMSGLPADGAMVAVQASEQEGLQALAGLEDRVALAAVNGPESVVFSGERQAVLELAAEWEDRGRKTKRLEVSHAFHSPSIEPMLEEFGRVAAGVSFNEPVIRVVSNLTGAEVSAEQLCAPEYWVRHVRETVRFGDGVQWLAHQGVGTFVELGPDGVLSPMVEGCLASSDLDGGAEPAAVREAGAGSDGPGGVGAERVTLATPVMRKGRDEARTLLAGLAQLWVQGMDLDWSAVFEGSGARRVELPTYAFQRERYWLDAVGGSGDVASVGQAPVDHPLLGAAVALADASGWLFTGRLSLREHPWLADHTVMGRVVLPGTAFLELAVHAGAHLGCGLVRELTLQAPLVLGEQGGVQLQVAVGREVDSGARALSVYSRSEEAAEGGVSGESEWVCHASGLLAPLERDERASRDAVLSPQDGVWPPAGAEPLPVEELYDRLAGTGLDYGPVFRGLGRAWRREEEVFAEIELPDGELESASSFALHPALLDAALHAVAFLDGSDEQTPVEEVRLPFSWSEVAHFASGASALRVRVTIAGENTVSLVVADQNGRPVANIGALAMREASAEDIAGSAVAESVLHLHWVAATEPAPISSPTPSWTLIGADLPALGSQIAQSEANLESYADLSALREAITSGLASAPDVVLLDLTAPGLDPPGDAHAGTLSILSFLQEWLHDDALALSRLAVMTRGAVAAYAGEDVRELAAAAIWGLLSSAQSENPGRLVLVDLDGKQESTAAIASALAGEEPRLAIRGGDLFVPRLVHASASDALTAPADGSPWQLSATGESTVERLALVGCPDAGRQLVPGEVRIAVRAAGLNFRDVLIGLGVYPGQATIGSEAAGVVLEVGPGVEDVAVGDRVMGLFSGAFAQLAIADSRQLARIPQDWSFAQAASVPLVFLTAYYALVDLGDLKPGDRFLVHSAAGGVGMAAVQLARYMGAEVFGTASREKWDVLERQGLDCDHLDSSRELGFGERFLEATEGAGMDVILNSLTGEFVDTSLELLAEGGRFLEMGKTDVRDPDAIASESSGARYRSFDLMDAGPVRIKEMLGELMDLFERGALELSPIRAWDVREASRAFRFMSQARHVGKIVLTFPSFELDPRGTVMITGGTGGLGGLVARHLVVEHGTRNLLLVSRTGHAAAGARRLREDLAELGANVTLACCDVADRRQLQELIGSIAQEHPLRAIVHAAGVLDDGVIGSLTPQRLEGVLAPKVDGAWNLHELTRNMDLDAFVTFSSAAATLGGAGQGNYAAANAFLDALAVHRRANGLPAVAMAWGPWAQAGGMVGELDGAQMRRIADSGLLTLSDEQGLQLFDMTYATEQALVLLARLDGSGLRARAREGVLPRVLEGLIRRPPRSGVPARDGSSSLGARLATAPLAERRRIVFERARADAAAVLGHGSLEALDSAATFKELGFDSLAGVELRNRLSRACGVQLPATLVFDYPTLEAVTHYLLEEMSADTGEPAEDLGLDLGRLQQALSSLSAEQARRSGVAARLQGILSTWASADEAAEAAAGDDDLSSATDDEIFDLIDREFGVS
jgi:acyl transferase domain-containing protein/nucleoside-diphosphate-sugar epimerase/acyl carrier protein